MTLFLCDINRLLKINIDASFPSKQEYTKLKNVLLNFQFINQNDRHQSGLVDHADNDLQRLEWNKQ